jgi:predicted esterase
MGAVERHLEVRRTARYWVLGEEVAAPREAWFVLHGYGQLARRFLHRFQALDDGTRRVVAPEALSRFYPGDGTGRHGSASVVGATWMTREDREREIDDYVGYLDRLDATVGATLPGGVPRTVLGFSQGVATAARWTVLGAIRPARLILWGDFLPPDLDLGRAREAWARTEVLLVRGTRDPALSDAATARRESEAVAEASVGLRHVSYDGGHDIDQATLRLLLPQSSAPSSAT